MPKLKYWLVSFAAIQSDNFNNINTAQIIYCEKKVTAIEIFKKANQIESLENINFDIEKESAFDLLKKVSKSESKINARIIQIINPATKNR